MSASAEAPDCRTLILYGTDGCHLCEEALQLVLAMPELRGWALDYIDIALDPALLSAFGAQIPVLALPYFCVQLRWPFAAADVRALLMRED